MQRPHRSIGIRIQRRVNLLGARLPPRTRRLLRGLADRWAPVIGTTGRRVSIPWSRAECVTTFDAWQVVTDLAAALRTALVDSGVEVVQLERSMQIVLAVPREQRASALQALRAVASGSELVGQRVAGQDRGTGQRAGRPAHRRRPLRLPGAQRSQLRHGLAGPGVGRPAAVLEDGHQSAPSRARRGLLPPRHPGGSDRNGRAPYLLPGQWKEAVAPPRAPGAR